jgi:polyisoprenoid-binding protein YceI
VHSAIDAARSQVEFTVRHLSVSNVHGHFGKMQGSITLDEHDISKSNVEVTIFVDSIDTDESSRDTVLKSADFFDTDRYPTATFKSTSVARVGDQLKVMGNLTLHGITKALELDVRSVSSSAAAEKSLHTTYQGSTTLSRASFGIGAAFPSALVGDDIKVSIALDVVRQ